MEISALWLLVVVGGRNGLETEQVRKDEGKVHRKKSHGVKRKERKRLKKNT